MTLGVIILFSFIAAVAIRIPIDRRFVRQASEVSQPKRSFVIELGFSLADVVVEDIYSTHYEEHAMLETESAVAYLEPDGTVVVYASAQAPHRDRMQIARALGIPEAMVREITPHIGGAFGAKDEANIQIHAALLAHATNLPVKVVRTREESIQTHVKRHPAKIHYRMGATRDGKLTAIHMTAIGDTGPYVNAGEEVMMVMANYGVSPYHVPHARSETYTVLTNNPICGAFRGPRAEAVNPFGRLGCCFLRLAHVIIP